MVVEDGVDERRAFEVARCPSAVAQPVEIGIKMDRLVSSMYQESDLNQLRLWMSRYGSLASCN